MKTELIPRSKATNAYDLLADVVQAIEEEPRRVNMDTIIEDADKWATRCAPDDLGDVLKMIPTCGTIGCVAGWVQLLKGQRSTKVSCDPAGYMIGGEAWRLGHDDNPDYELCVDLYSLFYEGFPDGVSGTPEYAGHVVRRVREFMHKHEVALRARAVPE